MLPVQPGGVLKRGGATEGLLVTDSCTTLPVVYAIFVVQLEGLAGRGRAEEGRAANGEELLDSCLHLIQRESVIIKGDKRIKVPKQQKLSVSFFSNHLSLRMYMFLIHCLAYITQYICHNKQIYIRHKYFTVVFLSYLTCLVMRYQCYKITHRHFHRY